MIVWRWKVFLFSAIFFFLFEMSALGSQFSYCTLFAHWFLPNGFPSRRQLQAIVYFEKKKKIRKKYGNNKRYKYSSHEHQSVAIFILRTLLISFIFLVSVVVLIVHVRFTSLSFDLIFSSDIFCGGCETHQREKIKNMKTKEKSNEQNKRYEWKEK